MPSPNQITTNRTADSIARIQVDVRSSLSFDAMWAAHPLNWNPSESQPFRGPKKIIKTPTLPGLPPIETVQPGEPIYEDQCAIKMSIALQAGGLSLSTFPKNRSELRYVEQLGKKVRGALAAEELANWLTSALGKPEVFDASSALAKVKSKKGIIFFKDFWTRPRESTAQGDHMDLWNGSTTPATSASAYVGENTYFTRSKSVWFWELK
jgi:hypothetical protein